ncbi:MAG TPA: LamG-like jellyroll fold domain-containing protein [Sedimentisphaerales bacterium]|nr:LamG-like jellyroll fold domain-containing protein [Sedimentisphaerales bacterium]
MCEKLTRLAAFVFVLSLVAPSIGEAADPNLVGWWRFNDGSGTAAIDSSGNDHHGVLVDNPVWISGIQGGALQFTGGNHVAVPGYDGVLGSRARTSAAWLNVTKTSASIITWGPAGGGTKWAMRTHNGPAAVRVECGQGNTWATTDLADGNWHHVAAVLEDDGSPDISEVKFYVDGKLDPTAPGGTPRAINTSSGVELQIAYDLNATGRTYDGMMDDVRIYDRALSAAEIQALIDNPGVVTQALAPDPNNEGVIDTTWYTLRWTPGDLAVSHQVYIGESFDDVNEGKVQPLSTAAPFLLVGFSEPFPTGLKPGATYYWRVDEVNPSEPGSPWKGRVWEFSVRPKTAWKPVPGDGARFVDPNVDLSWDPGVGAAFFYVYFGDSFADVNSAGGAPLTTAATYDPGSLETGKTYYWRVDEADLTTVHRGKVWSFTTTTPGGGLLGEYFNTMDLSGQPILTRTDPAIDFDLGAGSPEPNLVQVDGFSVRWRGEVEVAFSEVYTFYTRTNDGSRLWVDDKLIVDKWAWVNTVVDTRGKPIQLVAGGRYSIQMEWYNEDGNAEAHLFWESASEPKAIIPSAAFSPPVRAGSPSPGNEDPSAAMAPVLKWSAGLYAASHEVYFGTDADALANATKTSPEYKGSRTLGSESYDPGVLVSGTTYYWRVDEANNDGTISEGSVWSFTVGDFLVVDDIESYNDLDEADPASKRIYLSWIDGFGTTTNGAFVGNLDVPLTERSNVHGGAQAMPLSYDNNLKFSEATMTLTAGNDWTRLSVAELSLWFRGDGANAAEPMYVALNGTAVVYHDNPNAVQIAGWTQWIIPLQRFADQGVNLTNVTSITIGFGTRGNTTVPGGTGQMYFDDIRLYRSRTAP